MTLVGAYQPQETNLPELLKVVPVSADMLEVDNLGNAYLITGDEVVRYSKDGNANRDLSYSDKTLGTIYSLDVSQPLKLLLFYKELSQVAFLDNKLSIRGEPVALDELGYEQAALACSAFDNGMWIYDQLTFELIRLDRNLKEQFRSGNINQLVRKVVQPNFVIEANNWVYLNDPSLGILVFDSFGTYYKTLPIKNLKHFQITDPILFFDRGEGLETFHLKRLEFGNVELPELNFRQFGVSKDRLIFLSDEGLHFYRWPT